MSTLIFDADDTLWENNIYYDRVREGWARVRAGFERRDRRTGALCTAGEVPKCRVGGEDRRHLRHRHRVALGRAGTGGEAIKQAGLGIEVRVVRSVVIEVVMRHSRHDRHVKLNGVDPALIQAV